MPHGRDLDEARQREAQRTLESLKRPDATFAESSLAQAARRGMDHFSGTDAVGAAEGGGTDPMELWGRRIGRGLSLIAFIALAAYLYWTYLR